MTIVTVNCFVTRVRPLTNNREKNYFKEKYECKQAYRPALIKQKWAVIKCTVSS